MSFRPYSADDDGATVVVYLSDAQAAQFEALLGELRAIDPATDDNDVCARIFATGLAAEWGKLKEITP